MYWELFGLALCTALFVLSLRHFSRSESSAAPLVPVPHAAAPQEPDSAVEDTAAFDSCGRELATESRRNEPENLLEGEAEDDETSAEGGCRRAAMDGGRGVAAGGGRRAAGGGRRGGSSDESFAQAILRQRKRSWATEMLSTNCIRRTRCVRPSFGWAHGRCYRV
jgi:hypothetical protein